MHTLMGIRDLLMLYRSAPTGLSCADMFELREFTMVLYLFRNTCLIAIGGPLVNRFLGTDHEETLVDALQKKTLCPRCHDWHVDDVHANLKTKKLRDADAVVEARRPVGRQRCFKGFCCSANRMISADCLRGLS